MPLFKPAFQWIGFALVFLGTSCPATWGKTWTVANGDTPCASADFSTIAAAINAAAAGDKIDVCPALYPEQLIVTKPLTLRGIGGQSLGRAVIQPAQMIPVGNLGFTAVITVMNASAW